MKSFRWYVLNTLSIALVGVASSSAYAISVSTDILRGGLATYGTLGELSNAGAQVNYINFVTLAEGHASVQYNSSGSNFDLSTLISGTGPGLAERGAVQQIQINGYNDGAGVQNLFLRDQTNTNNPGFGAHANWLVTIDLNAVRTAQLGSTTNPLSLTGAFGAWGSIGNTSATAGVIAGAIYLDGVRIDSMTESVANPAAVNQSFSLILPNSGQYLTFAILNGVAAADRTLWDDGIFQNVNLEAVPEPSTAFLMLFGLAGFAMNRRRK